VVAVLFSTTRIGGSRQAEFERLLTSLKRQEESAGPLRVYILLQGCDEIAADQVRKLAPKHTVLVCSPHQLSLSSARNELLEFAQRDPAPGPHDIVAFPDDDCWYPDHFLARVTGVFRARPELSLMLCGSSPKAEMAHFDACELAPVSVKELVRKTSSNTMFFRGDLFSRIGNFDSSIGVGTTRPGGEDIDYALRGFLLATSCGIIDRPLVGHPAWDRGSIEKYFHGNLIVLARYARSRPSLFREFARKVMVGAYLASASRLPWRAYRTALGDAATAFRLTKFRAAQRR
jgi:hypothetical protein